MSAGSIDGSLNCMGIEDILGKREVAVSQLHPGGTYIALKGSVLQVSQYDLSMEDRK